MKKILEVKQIGEETLVVRLEATKRRKIWLKKVKELKIYSCNPDFCPLYYDCSKMCSPLKKYPNFSRFCNHLFDEYPELKRRLGVRNINQIVPIKHEKSNLDKKG